MSLINFLKNMLNSLLDGSFERVRIINEMNKGFKVDDKINNEDYDKESRTR